MKDDLIHLSLREKVLDSGAEVSEHASCKPMKMPRGNALILMWSRSHGNQGEQPQRISRRAILTGCILATSRLLHLSQLSRSLPLDSSRFASWFPSWMATSIGVFSNSPLIFALAPCRRRRSIQSTLNGPWLA